MDGIFFAKKPKTGDILLLLLGLFLLGMGITARLPQWSSSWKTVPYLIIGCGLTVISLLSLTMNRGAYIHISEDWICGKYHRFGHIDCAIEQIDFVMAQGNTLTILLKNGKRHIIYGLENAPDLSSALRKKLFHMENSSPQELRQKMERIQASRKKELWYLLGFSLLLFVNILIAVLLTDGKDMSDFGRTDWYILGVMGVLELLTIVGMFYIADRCGKKLLPIEALRYRLRGAVIATHPLPPNSTDVYTGENYTHRIVLCGFPNDPSVYFFVEKFSGIYELKSDRTSQIYPSKEDLPEDLFLPLIHIPTLP